MNKVSRISGVIIAIVLLGGLVFYFTSQNRSENTGGSMGPVSRGESFETWADYLESEPGKRSSSKKVVFVGIDGAAWNIIDPLIADGLLPTFARLKAEGAHGVLRSVDCYVSPPAWATMMTGYLPEKNGVFTFGIWNEAERQFLNITSQDVKTPSVWDVTSFMHKKTAVLNVPVTYPVREVDGIMVSGLLTPASLAERKIRRLSFEPMPDTERNRSASHSPLLRASFQHLATRLTIFLRDTKDDGRTMYDAVYMELDDKNAEFPVGQYSDWVPIRYQSDDGVEDAWCKVLVFPTNETNLYAIATSRVFFDVGDTKVTFTHPEALQIELKNRFDHYLPSKFVDRGIIPSFTDEHIQYATFLRDRDDWDLFLYVFTQTDNIQHLDGVTQITKMVYQKLDQYLSDLVATLPDDTILMLASDHGFTQYTYSIDLNKLFEQMGLLSYKDGAEIDHDRTLVFHNLWNIYFNSALLTVEELGKRGIEIASGQSPREVLLSYLERAKPSFRIPEGNRLIHVELFPFPDNEFEHSPDMIVKGTYTDYMVEFWNLTRPRESVIRRLRADELWNHTREGIYLFYGKGVKRGFTGPVENIQDIAPTILHLLGLPLAADMDGRVIHSAFDRSIGSSEYAVVEGYGQIYAEAATEEEREALEKKLRSLGYIR